MLDCWSFSVHAGKAVGRAGKMSGWKRGSLKSGKSARDKRSSGFNLPELIAVIGVIGVLLAIAIPVYMGHQAKSRDRRRLSDIRAVEAALEAYKFEYDCYPPSDYQGPGGWDDPSDGDFCHFLADKGLLEKDVTDPMTKTNYRYYRYAAGSYGADASLGAFYVVGIIDLEKSGRPAADSPGWRTPGRNWQNEFDWVTGSFTNE